MKNSTSFLRVRAGLFSWASATFLFAAMGSGSAWGQARIVDIANNVNDPSNLDDSEPSIAVNPLNPMEIVIVTFSEPWGTGVSAPVWKSTDGGFTWHKVTQIGAPSATLAGPNDQKIGFDSAGRLYVAELGIFPATDFIYRQTAGPDNPLTAGASYGDDQPHLDLDKVTASACFNRLYSPWLNTGLARAQSNVANSTTGGAAMASIAAGDNSSFPNRTTRIALGPDGKAYIIYKTREGAVGADFETAHFYVRRSDDCGITWTAIGGTSGVPVHGTTAVTTWFTNNFGNPAKGNVGRARSSDAWIATDPNSGDVYAVYANQDSSGFGQLFVTRSTTQGATWSAPVRVTDGTHNSAYPEIAVAGNGAVGVLYIDYDDSGVHTIFRHHLARSFDNGASWTDQILQSEDPSTFTAGTFRNFFLWGDYEGLTALGKTFYGVFTGQSIGRATVQQDPIFFSETAIPASSDFYVRDWTTSMAVHDNGEEPSTGVWWTVSDVWNRLTNTSGGFNANDQPNHQVAQDGVPNFAFSRIHRKAAATGGSPDVNVSARFLFADYGLGSNYVDAGAGAPPVLTFAAGETVKTMADGAGFQWTLPATRSTHVCMAVEISSPADPYSPELVGRAPGVSDPLIVLDNNKAQINMDLPAMSEMGGETSFYALVHNAELFSRTVRIRYKVLPEVLRKITGSKLQVIGNPPLPAGATEQTSAALGAEGTLVLPNMHPGENRWIGIHLRAQALEKGERVPVIFEDIVEGRVANGFTLAPRAAGAAAVLQYNLQQHRAVFARLAAAFRVPEAKAESEQAAAFLRTHSIDEKRYLDFLVRSGKATVPLLERLLHEEKSKDTFETTSALSALTKIATSQDMVGAMAAHATLLNRLDALETMLQKARGDTDDILQMVRWQKQIYFMHPSLPNVRGAARVVSESEELIRRSDGRTAKEEYYPRLLESLLPIFRETAKALGAQGTQLEPDLAQMSSVKSFAAVEKAHRSLLVKLDSLAK